MATTYLGSAGSNAWEVRHALLNNSVPEKFNSREDALRWVRDNGFTLATINQLLRIVYYNSTSARP